MRLRPGVPELVASEDHAYVAVAGEQLTLFDAAARTELASVPLGKGAQIAFLGDHLLTVRADETHTTLQAFALPSLEQVSLLGLDGRRTLLASTPSRALITTESL